jgi:hypothetical protein
MKARGQKFFEVFDGQQISQKLLINGRSDRFALRCCQRTAEGKMEGEKRKRWMRLCLEAADGQDSNRLLQLISEIDRLLREKEMRFRNVRRETSKYATPQAATPGCSSGFCCIHQRRSSREPAQVSLVSPNLRTSLSNSVTIAGTVPPDRPQFGFPRLRVMAGRDVPDHKMILRPA